MRRLALAAASLLLACRHAPPPKEGAPVTLQLPAQTAPAADTTERVFVIGDAGEQGPVHTAAFAALRAMQPPASVPAALLVPGDVTYPRGLPDDCREARQSLRENYLDPAPDLPIYAVAGNHDHGDVDRGTNPQIALRLTVFDCARRDLALQAVGWTGEGCDCERRWHVPSGTNVVGAVPLVQAAEGRVGFTLVTFDSQVALVDPERVARALGELIDQLPPGDRLIVMGHHPFRSFGPHGTKKVSPQDAGTAGYDAYASAVGEAIRTRLARVALLVFGHDHTLQYLPGAPPQLISGAGAKESKVAVAPADSFAAGDTPGTAVLDLQANGSIVVTLLWKGAPRQFVVPAP